MALLRFTRVKLGGAPADSAEAGYSSDSFRRVKSHRRQFSRVVRVTLAIAASVILFWNIPNRASAQHGVNDSASEPSLAFFDSPASKVTTSIEPYVFSQGDIPLDLDPRPEMFDPAKQSQEADAIDLGLRNMIRREASDAAIRAAVNKMVRWARKIEPLRTQYYAGGPAALEALAQRSPRDVKVLARCATRWIGALELERADILSHYQPRQRNSDKADVRVDPGTYVWTFPPSADVESIGPVKSIAFAKAENAIRRTLLVEPNNAEALFAAAMLSLRQYGTGEDVTRSILSRASSSTGSYVSVSRLYALGLPDRNYERALLARRDKLREVVRGPSTGGGEVSLGSYHGQTLAPGTYSRGGNVYGQTHVPGPIIHSPSAQDLNEADALDAKVKQMWAQDRAESDKLVRDNPTSAELFVALARTYRPGTITNDRILRYALMLNPSDFLLYSMREIVLAKSGDMFNAAESDFGHKDIAAATDMVQWAFRKGLANEHFGCRDLANRVAEKYHDPFISYIVAAHCMHLEPDRPAPRRELVLSFREMAVPHFSGCEFPDAYEQGQLESEVMYQIAARLLERKEEWKPGDKEETFVGWMAFAKFMRGEYVRVQHRDQEARRYYTQSIKLNPTATPAQKILDRMPK